jgi:hypothetical protein
VRVAFCAVPFPSPVPLSALGVAVDADVDAFVAAPAAALTVLHADGPLATCSVFASSYVVMLVPFYLHIYYYC